MELHPERKRTAEDPPRAYGYDLPARFRNQVIHIWGEVMGCILNNPLDLDPSTHLVYPVYDQINRDISEAFGLSGLYGATPCDALYTFFRGADTDQALKVIELTFAKIIQARR